MSQPGFCFNHPGGRAIGACMNCGVLLCGMCSRFAEDGTRCERCAEAHENAQRVEAQTELLSKPATSVTTAVTSSEATDSPGSSAAFLQWLPWIGMVLSLGGVGSSMYFYTNPSPVAVQESPSRAREEAATALLQCLQVFRQLGEQMAAGQEPDMSLRCAPPSGPNRLERDQDTLRVSHTDPQLYALETIFVTNLDPEPVSE